MSHLVNRSQLFAGEISSFDRANFLYVCRHQQLPILNNFVYAKVTFGYLIMPTVVQILKIQDFFNYEATKQYLVTVHGGSTCQVQH